MNRFATLFCVLLAGPVSAQSLIVDPVGERPGRWISVPPAPEPAPVLEAPSAAPLIPTVQAPSVVMVAPEAAPVIEPPRAAPDTRPVPRPSIEVAEVLPEVAQVPVIAAEVARALEEPLPEAASIDLAPVVEVAQAPAPAPLEPPRIDTAPDTAISDVAPTPVETAPVDVAALPDPIVTAALEGLDAAAMAEALATELAVQARQITLAGPREIPQADLDIGQLLPAGVTEVAFAPPVEVVEQVEPLLSTGPDTSATPQPEPGSELDEAALAAINDVLQGLADDATRGFAPSAPEPEFVLQVAALPSAQATVSDVLLPRMARSAAPVAPPLGAIMPTLERTPILPRLSPSGPPALDRVNALEAVSSSRLSAVLLPNASPVPTRIPNVTQVAFPGLDLFPYSALPPSALPGGPEALARTIAPRAPFAEMNAAVLITGPDLAPLRVRAPLPSVMPAPGEAPVDPDRAPELPAPDALAVARMIEDAQICWRLADLTVEAQWAEVSIDVALDEWNMPSAGSITFTGFAHVVSSAAEDAFRAAHSSLMGCAMASENTPATSATTLLFDRNGVHLR